MDLKPGDYVRYVGNADALKLGQVSTEIAQFKPGGVYVYAGGNEYGNFQVVCARGITWALTDEEIEPWQPKPGDYVEHFAGNGHAAPWLIGKRGKVRSTHEYFAGMALVCFDEQPNVNTFVATDNLKPVLGLPPTTGENAPAHNPKPAPEQPRWERRIRIWRNS